MPKWADGLDEAHTAEYARLVKAASDTYSETSDPHRPEKQALDRFEESHGRSFRPATVNPQAKPTEKERVAAKKAEVAEKKARQTAGVVFRNGDDVALVQDGERVTGKVMRSPDGTLAVRVKEKVARSAAHPDGVQVRDVPVKDRANLTKLIDNGGMRFKRGEGAVTPAEDAAYMDAVKRGDMDAAQRMVREAAKRKGWEILPALPFDFEAGRGLDSKIRSTPRLENFIRDKNPSRKLIARMKELNIVFGSPFSYSFYNSPAIDWDYKPDRSYRVSDHWNFYSRKYDDNRVHCQTDKEVRDGVWTLAQYHAEDGLYHVLEQYGSDGNGSRARDENAARGREFQRWLQSPSGEMYLSQSGKTKYSLSNAARVVRALEAVDRQLANALDTPIRRGSVVAWREALLKLGKDNPAFAGMPPMPAPMRKRGVDWAEGVPQIRYFTEKGPLEAYDRESGNRKSLAAVVFDDAGEVIPLSQRFNPEKADLRFKRGAADFDKENGTELASVVSLAQAMRTNDEKTIAGFRGRYFRFAKTNDTLKGAGLSGDYFTIRAGVILRHNGKDAAHDITPDEWGDIADALTNKKPEIVERFGDRSSQFRIWTQATIGGRAAIVGAEVKNIGRDIDINAVQTVFGVGGAMPKEENIVYPKSIEEKRSVLTRHNSGRYTASPQDGNSISQTGTGSQTGREEPRGRDSLE